MLRIYYSSVPPWRKASFLQRLEPSPAVFDEFAEELHVMEPERVYGRRKDSQDDIEQVDKPSHRHPGHDIAGQPAEIVRHEREQDRGEADGHDTDVGDDVADAFEEFQGREQPPGEEQKRREQEDRDDDGPREHGREDLEERREDGDQAEDNDDAQKLVDRLFLFLFFESRDGPQDEPEKDMGHAHRKGEKIMGTTASRRSTQRGFRWKNLSGRSPKNSPKRMPKKIE